MFMLDFAVTPINCAIIPLIVLNAVSFVIGAASCLREILIIQICSSTTKPQENKLQAL